jgi:hypothetical protein
MLDVLSPRSLLGRRPDRDLVDVHLRRLVDREGNGIGDRSRRDRHRVTPLLDLSCIGLVTTLCEVVQDLLGGGGDSRFGGDLLAAEGDRGVPPASGCARTFDVVRSASSLRLR